MSEYEGPVTLLMPDGAEKTVPAKFWTDIEGGLNAWNGRIDADDETLWHALTSSMSLTVRLPDGREGQILVLGNDGRVAGTGPAPFEA